MEIDVRNYEIILDSNCLIPEKLWELIHGVRKVKIRHFGGVEFAVCENEMSEILTQRYGNDVNEFWITEDD